MPAVGGPGLLDSELEREKTKNSQNKETDSGNSPHY